MIDLGALRTELVAVRAARDAAAERAAVLARQIARIECLVPWNGHAWLTDRVTLCRADLVPADFSAESKTSVGVKLTGKHFDAILEPEAPVVVPKPGPGRTGIGPTIQCGDVEVDARFAYFLGLGEVRAKSWVHVYRDCELVAVIAPLTRE